MPSKARERKQQIADGIDPTAEAKAKKSRTNHVLLESPKTWFASRFAYFASSASSRRAPPSIPGNE